MRGAARLAAAAGARKDLHAAQAVAGRSRRQAEMPLLPEQVAQCRGDAVALWLAGLHKLDEESVGVSDTDDTGGVKG